MKYRYTLDQLININRGSVQDAQKIIQFYKGRGLIEIHNNKDHAFFSNTLTAENLILKSDPPIIWYKFKSVIDWISSAISIGETLFKLIKFFIKVCIIYLPFGEMMLWIISLLQSHIN